MLKSEIGSGQKLKRPVSLSLQGVLPSVVRLGFEPIDPTLPAFPTVSKIDLVPVANTVPYYYTQTPGVPTTEPAFIPCSLVRKSNANASHFETLKNFVIFPNPTSNKLEIDGLIGSNVLIITNQIGEVEFSLITEEEKIEIDISKLKPGVYFIKANEILFKKFVKI